MSKQKLGRGNRMSSLPTTEFCGGGEHLPNWESVRAQRSSVVHAWCATGKWPAKLNELPAADREEIASWHRPTPLQTELGDLDYAAAEKELQVGLSEKGDWEPDPDRALTVGHLDCAWPGSRSRLAVVGDLKSSIFAAADGADSLQIAAYGIAFAQRDGAAGYLPAVWDLSAGRWYLGTPVLRDSWEWAGVLDRVLRAARNTGIDLTTGVHCGTCWNRFACPAHRVRALDESEAARLLGDEVELTGEDVARAAELAKRFKDTSDALSGLVRAWALAGRGAVDATGRKRLRVVTTSGRSRLDRAAAQEAGLDLDRYMVRGGPISSVTWGKR